MSNKLIKVLSMLLMNLFFTFSFISCEDDPLLAPQSDTEPDGGSYGLLLLNEGEDLDKQEINPEIF